MSGYQKPSDPVAELAAKIAQLESRLRDLERPNLFQIPVVNTDPPTTDPTNMWLFPDGRLRARHKNAAGTAWVTREWVPTAAGSATSATAPASAGAAPQTYENSWAAIWSQSYRQSGAQRTDQGAVSLYYGSSGDGFNGRNRSLVGFDYSAIATALSGSTVSSVSLTMQNLHSWYNSGSEIHFGIHNYTAKPGTWAGGGIPRSMISKHAWGKTQAKTVAMPLEFATAIRDGWGKGIALESPSDSRTFYGYAAGVGSGQQVPVLTIRYAK